MSVFLQALALFAGAFLLALLAVLPVRRLAWRLDLVDRPAHGDHKSHLRLTPYGGGIAIWMGAAIPLFHACDLLSSASFTCLSQPLPMLFACGTALLLIGLLDDWRGLSPLPRLLVQLLAALTLLWRSPEFHFPLPIAPALSLPLSALWIVALTNAFNFLDNMDGLAAGIAAVALLLLTVLGLSISYLPGVFLCLPLLGALAGFLVYNFPPATIFMGDAGAFFIGFMTGSLTLLFANHLGRLPLDFPQFLAPLLVLTVPVYDLLGVTLIRLKKGLRPWIGDKNHISHRLVELGLSRRTAVLVIYAATLLAGLPALFLARLTLGGGWILLALVVLGIAGVAGLDVGARRRRSERAIVT